MKPARPPDQRTRRRVIQAATRLFATHGFKRVTVRAICRDARANVAAVNYHFRNKLGLYTEVLATAAAEIQEVTDAAIHAGEGRPADDKLRAYIRVHCKRLFTQGTTNHLQQLIQREMQDPTPALESLINRAFRPRFEYLANIVGDRLGLPADDERVVHCAVSVHAQVIMFRPNAVIDRLGGKVKRMFTLDRVTSHIAAFSVAGIDVYRRPLTSRASPATHPVEAE